MKLRRSPHEEVAVATDLRLRLAHYRSMPGIHCKGCGRWVAEEESQVEQWGYFSRSKGYALGPCCERCARLGLASAS
jgi:hypothetical protein